MKAAPENPPGNALPRGTTQDAMEDAVGRSGYPMQTEVAIALLGRKMDVHEEWSYADRDTEKLRAIDVMATKGYETSDDTVVPRLALVVECKRSEHPYVFFRSATDELPPDFPAVYGLSERGLNIAVAGKASMEVFASQALGLDELSFVKSGPPLASTFARADPKGDKKRQLSGEDVFSGIVMPLIGAMNQAATMLEWGSAGKKYPALTLGIGVLDAPMLLADSRQRPNDLMLAPWVRVARQEVVRDAKPSDRKVRFFAFDIVHSSFLEAFLDKHLFPSVTEYVERVNEMRAVIRRGGGHVSDLSNWKWSELKA
jgi:hypothetical protein